MTHPQTTARLNGIERESADAIANRRRRERVEKARDAVRSFVEARHIDVAAATLIALRCAHPGRTITRTEVLDRMHAAYPSTKGET